MFNRPEEDTCHVGPCSELLWLVQDELVRVGMSEMLIGRCLHYLQQQGDIELVRGRRMIHRIR